MKIIDFLRDTRGELKHVSWPTRKQSIWFTIIVIALSVVTALLLGFFDYLFSTLIDKFVI
jgi:preprotein translocase subunit SecE